MGIDPHYGPSFIVFRVNGTPGGGAVYYCIIAAMLTLTVARSTRIAIGNGGENDRFMPISVHFEILLAFTWHPACRYECAIRTAATPARNDARDP
jgi:hypothetical protein